MGYETIEIYQKGVELVPPKKEVQIEDRNDSNNTNGSDTIKPSFGTEG